MVKSYNKVYISFLPHTPSENKNCKRKTNLLGQTYWCLVFLLQVFLPSKFHVHMTHFDWK